MGLYGDLTPWERALSESTPLTMSAQQQTDACWAAEGVLVLLWAFERVRDLPPFDQPASRELLRHECLVAPAALLESPGLLRPVVEMEEWRAVAELWQWRSKLMGMTSGENPFMPTPEMEAAGVLSLGEVIEVAAEGAVRSGIIPRTIEGDFPAKSKPYRLLEAHEWGEVASLTAERYRALNWVCGHSPGHRWDHTPTEV